MKLNKKKFLSQLNKAFYYCRSPTFDQFVKGFDFVLKKIIPTLRSPIALYVAKKLMNTPDAIAEDLANDTTETIRLNVDFIINEGDIFERLYDFSVKHKMKLVLVKLIHKNHYQEYKIEKELNKNIRVYNEIVKNQKLFDTVPGKLGFFDVISDATVKINDPVEDAQQNLLKKELIKRKFLESLMETHSTKPKTEKEALKPRVSKFLPSSEPQVLINKRQEKKNLMQLQAKANEIDRVISENELEREKFRKNTIESNAFPNNPDITPQMLLNLLEYSKSSSKELVELKEYIYGNKEKINYQDIMKFMIAENISAKTGKNPEILMNSKTIYNLEQIKEKFNENEDVDEETLQKIMGDQYKTLGKSFRIKPTVLESQLTFDEPKYLKDKKRKEIDKSGMNSKERGCECKIF